MTKTIIKNSTQIPKLDPEATTIDKEQTELKKEAKPSWVKKVSRDISLTSIWYSILGHSRNMKKIIGFNFDNVGYYFNGEFVEGLKDKKQLLKLKEFLSKIDDKEILNLLNSFKKQLDKRDKIIKEFIDLKLLDLSKNDILTNYLKFHNHYPKYWGYHVIMFFIMDLINSLNRENFLKKNESLLRELRSVNPYLDVDEKLLSNLYGYISNKENIPSKYLYFLLPEEVLSYLKSGSEINTSELKERFKGYLVLSINGKSIRETGNTAKIHYAKIFSQDSVLESCNKIKGQIAFKGLVNGRVVVVKTKSDFKKIKEGDVLVAFMTTIDFIPYLKKVTGIVTDEGGVGCHAAISAREFKKPCVIGTKIATRTLNDGDIVEVDANNGIIKILKTNN